MKVYKRNGVVGGTSTDLDYIDGDLLEDKDFALVLGDSDDTFSPFELDADSGLADDGVNVIAPLTNAGTKRWIRKIMAGAYDVSNIIGTVSQSSGVPTGAIIERGSNANGDYVKFADGTLICTQTLSNITTSVSVGNVFVNSVPNATYPAAFAAAPILIPKAKFVAGSSGSWGGVSVGDSLTSTGGFNIMGATSAHVATPGYVAIGRWF